MVTLLWMLSQMPTPAAQLLGRGVAFPIFLGDQREPAASVRAETVSKDYQRKGFFKIGLLPQLVAENVTVRFNKMADAEKVLSALSRHKWVGNNQLPVEFRTVRFETADRPEPILSATSLTFGEAGKCHLKEVTLTHSRTNRVRLKNATLQLSGTSVAALKFRDGTNDCTITLFAPGEAAKRAAQIVGGL